MLNNFAGLCLKQLIVVPNSERCKNMCRSWDSNPRPHFIRASANGTSISASVMQGTELCREVEFYDSRAAEAFRNAIMVLERSREGRSSVNTSLGEITAPGELIIIL